MDPANLSKYKLRLLKMRERLIPTVDRLEENMREAVRAPGDYSNAPTHLGTMDSEGLDNELGLAENEEQILEQVEKALERIDNGTYGNCVRCGQPIPDERLEVLPYTPHCIRCAEEVGQQAG
ncbi:MAG: TraR/DksA C4-type zinc finger protein [Thermoguttaceae bacterium]|jgi:RNA polymerase-binding protein DksA